ncbi:hypothetical protein CsatB_029316 [Cannabis sativa]|uniref:uncharacterized protein LOC133034329 n=1 Tax=Cannabis sativa TaxID=3483 RepID=UPI0029CA35EE|nr:uncharacterized protein LOC133034329 [Cannabis sativa]
MDFVTRLPRTTKQHDSFWIIIDRLTKSAHFVPVKSTYNAEQYADMYVKEILRLHGVPKTIVSDRGSVFTSKFWESPHKDEVGEIGPEAVREASEAVEKIRQRMLNAQSRLKSYADLKRQEVEFSVGDLVFLKVSPMKGIMRFGKRGKLSPRFIGPFEILDRVGQDMSFMARPVRVIEEGIKVLRNKIIPLVKILWSDSSDREATWELEKDM